MGLFTMKKEAYTLLLQKWLQKDTENLEWIRVRWQVDKPKGVCMYVRVRVYVCACACVCDAIIWEKD